MKAKQLYEVYHNTMRSAIDAAFEYVRGKGYEPQDTMFWEPVFYGQTSHYHITLFKNGIEQKRCLQMQIYRMDSGKYELNAYIN